MPARLEFGLVMAHRPGAGDVARRRREDEPVRLLLIGNFGGSRGDRAPLASRTTYRIDLDNQDETMARIAPSIAFGVGDTSCEFAPRTLDDFHPDRLLQSLPPLRASWQTRAQLADPAQFAQASQQLLGNLLGGTTRDQAPSTATPAPAAARGPAGPIDALLRDLVAPYIRPGAPPEQPALVAAAEDALARQLREVLHAGPFKELEMAWRAAAFLVSRLELDESLQLHLFDATADELRDDVVGAQGRIEHTGVYATLVDRWRNQPGGQGWSALLGLWRFGPDDADIGLLAALGILASQAGGPFIGGGTLELSRDDASRLAGWQALRASEVAPWLALVAPRMLLRLPYGRAHDPIESFDFEELEATPAHEHYLWAPGSLAAAQCLGRSASQGHWPPEAGEASEIDDLPACTRTSESGESELVPVSEFYLGDRDMGELSAAGLMPLASHRQRNVARLLRWRSVSSTDEPLSGFAPA